MASTGPIGVFSVTSYSCRMEEDSKGTLLSNVIRIDDDRVREHLGRIVRGTVEEMLNTMGSPSATSWRGT